MTVHRRDAESTEKDVQWAHEVQAAINALKRACCRCPEGPRPPSTHCNSCNHVTSRGGCGSCVIEQALTALGISPPRAKRR